MKILLAGVAGALGAAIVIALWWAHGGQGWLAIHTGTDYCVVPRQYVPVCRYYGFWSGFGSDLGELTLIAVIGAPFLAIWRTHTCHYTWWCWRRPLHPVADSPYKVCHVHHPEDVQTVKEAVAAQEAQA